jgi:type IV pilus assembly protein PilA
MLSTIRNKKAVTLVELLAVIVILAIIAAIAVPTIGNMIDRQRGNAAAASGNAVVESLRLYATENPTVPGTYVSTAELTAVIDEFITTVPAVVNITFTVTNGVVSVAATDAEADMTIDGYVVDLSGGLFVRQP